LLSQPLAITCDSHRVLGSLGSINRRVADHTGPQRARAARFYRPHGKGRHAPSLWVKIVNLQILIWIRRGYSLRRAGFPAILC
jgi:hypothetical protein